MLHLTRTSILIALIMLADRLIGLELGADGYVCKPFSPREVVARVRTIQRRLQQQPAVSTDNELSYRDITLYLDRYECIAQGQRIELTPVEFKMLRGFMAQPGRVFSRDQLMDISYPDKRIVSDGCRISIGSPASSVPAGQKYLQYQSSP